MKILVLAIGKLRGAEAEWCAEYQKRIGKDLQIAEKSAPKSLPPAATQKWEQDELLGMLPDRATLVLLDERGKDMPSRDFAAKFGQWRDQGVTQLTFMIGGADGVTDDIRKRADFTLSFGRLTWPHRLVRVMLLEQIYRAQQILAGHPYHRD